ncbi:integrase arm-type DNA-binding domain-containing protein [Agarivorans litoreus]|uniref:integrase arm-type DNA-binding domain-containing protein n=1 Tax=Agarivorans litoreus TaxID=1510455 RepID=UPI001C7CAD7C|nr:integrase arm-type DNA-binding domain-containing protein [Agarivorans litoreus]
MARTAVPLTNTQIKQAKAKQAEYSLADGDGLSLRIRPNGSKSWFFNYVVPVSGKRFKISFGQYPEVSLADARRKRVEARALVAAGVDPKVHSQQMRKKAEQEYSQTLQVVAKHWFERWKQQI